MTDPQNTLLGFTPETLKAVTAFLESCQDIIKDNLVNDIEIYQELKNLKNKKQFAINNLVSTLDRINTSPGWNTFIQLFNIAKEDKEPVTFTDVLPILNESIIPNLPWGLPPKCWLFDETTETLFLNPGTYNINKESIIGEVIPLNAVDAEIAKRLQLGTHRDKQIMDLYLNICIAECFQKPVILAKGDPTSVERELHFNPLVDGKPLKEFVKISNYLEKLLNKKFSKEEIIKSIKNCNFDNLKLKEETSGFVESQKNINNKSIPFFYLGPKNDWRNLINNNIKVKIETAFKTEMIKLNYL